MFASWFELMTRLGFWTPLAFTAFGNDYQRAYFEPGFAWRHSSRYAKFPYMLDVGNEWLGCPGMKVIERKTRGIRLEDPERIRGLMSR